MKNKKLLRTAAMFLCVMMAGSSIPSVPAYVYAEEAQNGDETAAQKETIRINTIEDLKKFTESCTTDAYSRGKVFNLGADLDVRGAKLTPVAIFCGIFEGNGHTISGFSLKESGSDMGFIRFLETDGIVRNLTIQGTVQPGGTGTNVGGIVGTNRGTIENCTFEGEVIAKEAAGGIAGYNEESGHIISCVNKGKLLGTKKTGGIAGNNDGLIENCSNKGGINATAETVSEAEDEAESGMTLDFSLDFSSVGGDDERISAMGGIAGLSAGTIVSCTNYGEVGYPHVGYHTGGIVGYQRGCVDGCRNEGRIQGRKDTGGIAGLFEPYVEINYEESTSKKLRGQMDDMIDMLDNLSDIARDADSDTLDNMDSVDESIDVIKDTMDNYKEHYQKKNDEFIDDMEEALDIVEKRIDMLDFDMDGETIANAILSIKKDTEEALKILETLKSLSGTSTNTYVGVPSGGGVQSTSLLLQQEENNATGDIVDGEGNESGSSEGGSSESGSGGSESGSSESGSGGSESGSGGSESGNGGSEGGSGGNEGGSSESGSGGSESGSGGSESGSGGSESARSMQASVFRASSLTAALPDSVKSAMRELGISEDELIRAMIAMGWDGQLDPTDPDSVAEFQSYLTIALQNLAKDKVLGLAQDMDSQSGKLSEAAMDAVGEGKSLVDNADKLGTEIKHVIHVAENHIKDIRDDMRVTDEDLSNQLDVLDGRIDVLKDRLRDANDDVIDQMDQITDQMHLINDTASDGLDNLEEKINDPDKDKELSDYYDDFSDSDDTTRAKGKVMNCSNQGEIISDINGGGIAGFLSVELFDSESEFEIEKVGSRSLDSKRKAVGTIFNCKNTNEVTAKNDYAGGIVGRADLGAVVACQNYGDVETTDGDYAGGIAGKSDYTIRGSYTLCNISGNSYAGGIAGEGSNIKDSYAMTSIFSEEGEKYGAIAGDADGEVSGNYFVDDGIAAVNGLTYASQAAPLTYEELIEMESTPTAFQKFTIRFLADDEEIKTITCGYGDSLKESDIPLPPDKDGILGTWDKSDFDNIRRNMIVRAVYGDWTTALSSGEELPNLLISGQFLPNASMEYSRLELETVPGLPGYEVKAAYEYTIRDESMEGETTLGIHVLTEGLRGKVCAAVIKDGRLKLVDGQQDGRYYVFEMTSDGSGQFVVLIQEINWKAVGIVSAAVLLVLAGLLIHAKRKKKRALKAEEARENADTQKNPEESPKPEEDKAADRKSGKKETEKKEKRKKKKES